MHLSTSNFKRSDGITILGGLLSRSFAEFHMFDAHSGEDVDGSIVTYGYFVRACSSCQNNRVLRSTEPKNGSLLLIILPGRSLLNAPVPCFEYLYRFAVAGEWVKMDAVEPVFGDDDEEGIGGMR